MKLLAILVGHLLVACTILSSSQARIGWTLVECREHYGKETKIVTSPLGSSFEVVYFQVGNTSVDVRFFKDRVANICYFKTGQNFGQKFTEEEIQVLLERNGGNLQWKPEGLDGKEHKVFFERYNYLYVLWTGFEDSQAVLKAEYFDDSLTEKPRPSLTISTVEYAKFVKSTMDANIEADMQKSRQNGGASILNAEEIKQLNQEAQAAKEREAKEKEQKNQDALKSTEGL